MDKRDQQPRDPWRAFLQEEFQHYEADTERDLWPGVARHLDGGRKPFYLLRTTWLVAASILLLFGAIWMLRQGPENAPGYVKPSDNTEIPAIQPVDQNKSPKSEMAAFDPLPRIPDEVAKALPVPSARPTTTPPQENRTESEMPDRTEIDDSPIPQNRVIRQPGPMQPVTMQNTPAFFDEAKPRSMTPRSAPVARVPAPSPPNSQSTERSQRQSIDLNEVTIGDVVGFASHELGKIVKSPLEVHTQEVDGEELKTYQLELFNFRITRKIHKKSTSNL